VRHTAAGPHAAVCASVGRASIKRQFQKATIHELAAKPFERNSMTFANEKSRGWFILLSQRNVRTMSLENTKCAHSSNPSGQTQPTVVL
jgi:hypothetical protein